MSRRVGSSSDRICIARIFGAPETVPAGKHATSASRWSRSSASRAVDRRDQVHDVRVALERHVLRHPHRCRTRRRGRDRSGPRSTSITCSARSFSLRFSSSASRRSSSSFAPRGRVPAIGWVSTRRPSTRTSISGDDPTIASPPMPDEIHVRRRVDVAQRAVDRERIRGDVGLEALRQHRLVDVARGDVLLDRPHAGFEVLPRLVGAELGRRRAPPARAATGRARARARGTESWRTRTDRARAGPRPAVTRALAMIRMRCLT